MAADDFSNAQIDDMEAYLRARRVDRARRIAQASSATASAALGKESGAQAMQARELYPDLMSPMEKAAAITEVNQPYGDLEKGYYDTSVQALTAKYTAEMATFRAHLSANAQLKAVSAQLRQQGKSDQAAHLERTVGALTATSPQANAFIRRNSLQASGAGDGELDPLAAAAAQTSSDPAVVAEGRSEILRTIQDRGIGGPDDAVVAMNDISAYAAATGQDPAEVAAEAGPAVAARYEALVSAASERKGELIPEYDAAVRSLPGGAGNMGTWEELQAQAPQFGDGLPEDEYDKDKQVLPGIDVIPESDAMDRYIQVMDVIEAQPEEPPVVEAKKHILASEPYQAYKKARNYDGMAEDQVYREYSREIRDASRQRKKEFRRTRKANIDAGTVKPRTPGEQSQVQRPKPRDTAEVAGGDY